MIRHPLIGLKYCRLYIVVRLIFHTIIMTSTIHLFVFAYWAIAVATPSRKLLIHLTNV